MAEVKITAQVRTDFGKGAARRARRADLVPAVIYGHGAEPQHVAIHGHELMMALKTPNVLIRLEFDGKNELVIPKAVQREAIRGLPGARGLPGREEGREGLRRGADPRRG